MLSEERIKIYPENDYYVVEYYNADGFLQGCVIAKDAEEVRAATNKGIELLTSDTPPAYDRYAWKS